MTRKDALFLVGLFLVAGLLLANLLRPGVPAAYSLPEGQVPVAIAASGDAAWAIVGNKVYYVTLRTPGEVSNRIINQIDSKELK